MGRKAKVRGGKGKSKSGPRKARARSKARSSDKKRASETVQQSRKLQSSGKPLSRMSDTNETQAVINPSGFDALADARRRRDEDEAKLKADPWFRSAVAHGERWEAAQTAVRLAEAPYRDVRDKLIRDHGGGYAADSSTARDFEALNLAIEQVKLDTFAAHGFFPAKDPRTPEEIGAKLAGLNPNLVIELADHAGSKGPSDAFEKESLQLWQAAEKWLGVHPTLPRLPAKPERGVDRLTLLRAWCEGCAVAEAYAAASQFLEHWKTLSPSKARPPASPAAKPRWPRHSGTYAMGFVAWFDLTHLLTDRVRNAARSVYSADAPAIRIDALNPKQSLIEAIVDEMGIVYRNALYAGRRHPFEPDVERITQLAKDTQPLGYGEIFEQLMNAETRQAIRDRLGVKTTTDAIMLIAADWNAQTPKRGEAAMQALECRSVDFDDLIVRLAREGKGAVAEWSAPVGKGRASLPLVATDGYRREASDEIHEITAIEDRARLKKGTWRYAAWFKQMTVQQLVPITPHDLMRARNSLVAKSSPGNRPRWAYTVESVIEHPRFASHRDVLLEAVADGLDVPRRTKKGSASPAVRSTS